MQVQLSQLTAYLPPASIRSVLLIPFEDQELPDQIRQLYPHAAYSVLLKKDLSGLTVGAMLRAIRSRCSDLILASLHGSTVPRSLSSIHLLLSLSGSGHALVRTDESSLEQVHRLKFLASIGLHAASGLLTILASYLRVTFQLLRLSLDGDGNSFARAREKKVLFLRADLGGRIRAGGSISHV
ncbi:MAG: hypothetical protein WD182_01455, partial [Bacteroidota bacterium]